MDTDHRPWPLPSTPWIMAQVWHDLLFAHWPVAESVLRTLIPEPLEIDSFDGQCWLGIVPFRMSGVRPRGVPAIPGLSAFQELNVRSYVTYKGKPGVYFFSLDAANPVAVHLARRLFHLPYFHSRMSLVRDGDRIEYSSVRLDGSRAELRMRYRPTGPIFNAKPGTLEHWLTERYCLYTVDNASRCFRTDIHHPPWPLQPAECEIQLNRMADSLTLELPTIAPILHFALRQDVIAWFPTLA